MAFKAICIILVIAVLLEDGSSMRKKTEEEKKEDRELAEKVNATLIEEEKKKAEEEKKKTKEGKTQEDDGKRTGGQRDGEEKATVEKKEGQDEACPPVNFTCPIVEPCPKPTECPAPVVCEECPEAKKCGPCPTVQPCKPCPEVNGSRVNVECGPDPSLNTTSFPPVTCECPEVTGGMPPSVAMAVGAISSLVVVGLVGAVGLLIRYTSPFLSGFVVVASIIFTWYLSSHYPATARELGGRVVEVLREATTALSHRVIEALRHHNDQVGLPVNSNLL
jgi:hypothetical protein